MKIKFSALATIFFLLEGCSTIIGKDFKVIPEKIDESKVLATINVDAQSQVLFGEFNIETCPNLVRRRLATFPSAGKATVALPADHRFYFTAVISDVALQYSPGFTCYIAMSFVPKSDNDYRIDYKQSGRDGCSVKVLTKSKDSTSDNDFKPDLTARNFTSAVHWEAWSVSGMCPN